ncbi:DNA replication pre-initiation complex subunit Cdc45 [Halteromyces radiatus]|uniref:DNA replication pre-initiation complex subunit Cdc45 n=1 Tax=Halteromyces radiatus TaxID=101107 RepID=UPI00221EE2E5|nr:DNA replication pre-initiation complex subunit Cdc45 [Halteromyces radiatus]KAI8089535.1 DNA replication pre-initiation complex subunit Cdc45 [Halteromyces radiatus]
MVRITSDRYNEAYERIKRDSLDGNCIIFVAPDVDAICCCKILQSLLKRDIIQHKIVPVSGYQDLQKANDDLVAKDEQLRTIIMINCGGLVELSEILKVNDLVTIYILDSHRPLHLDNIVGHNNICVFDDDDESEKMEELIQIYEELFYQDSEEDDDIEDDDEIDTDDERIQSNRPRQRRRLNDGTNTNKRLQQRKREEQLQDYYSSLYYANSSAGQMYILATQLGKTNNELLWLAITGVTAQYIFEKNDTTKYMDYVKRFSDDVALFNLSASNSTNKTSSSSSTKAEDSIQCEDEYRFMLFRHWSLYDSMFHSGYVASKLGVWREFGQKRLNNMFAKMGFSLQQCHQVYTHMDMDLKNILRTKIETVAPLYGLTDICFPSFSRTYGWKYRLSASDVVYALATLLETSPSAAAALGEPVDWNDDQDWGELEDTTNEHPQDLGSVRRKWWMRNFYTSYDSLNSIDGIRRGISLCMKIQKAIVRQGTSIIDKKNTRTLKSFRMVLIKDGPDLPLFQHPLTLSKLALFLTDAYREHGKRNLPFVISSLDEEHDSYLVVANTGAPTFGDVRRNRFGIAFQIASVETNARTSFDSFETSVLQIHKNDLEHFLEKLYVGAS